ncbi:MAG: hypothetical protein V5B33_14460 [Candidatus Accumulibacter sp. UW20]
MSEGLQGEVLGRSRGRQAAFMPTLDQPGQRSSAINAFQIATTAV